MHFNKLGSVLVDLVFQSRTKRSPRSRTSAPAARRSPSRPDILVVDHVVLVYEDNDLGHADSEGEQDVLIRVWGMGTIGMATTR